MHTNTPDTAQAVAVTHKTPARRLALAVAGVAATLCLTATTAAAPMTPTTPTTRPMYDAAGSGATAEQTDFSGGFEAFLRNAGNAFSAAATSRPATEPASRPAVESAAPEMAVAAEVKQPVPAAGPAKPAGPAPLVADQELVDGKLRITVKDTRVIQTSRPFTRVSVGSPEIADVVPLGPDTLMVSTKAPGTTQIVLWDAQDATQSLTVQSAADLREVQEKLDELLGEGKVEAVDLRGKIALRGKVRSVETAAMAADVASAYGEVVNFIELTGTQQVTLQIRFAEVSRTATKQLGVNFGYGDGVGSGANTIGQVSPIYPGGAGAPGGGPGSVGFPNNLIGSSVTLFGGGQIGSTAFEVFLSALRENNLLRVLAQPNLTVVSGQSAEFLAGGRIPIPVPQEGGTVAISYESYGVLLKATPVVLGDGRIRVQVTPEVSDIDRSNGVVSAGVSVPGFTVRRVTTEVELKEGQTFVLAGLLNSNVQALKQSVPLLGDVPILGTLFRSTRYQRRETELVVLITPHLVAPLNPGEVPPLPGEGWKHPNEIQLFLGGQLGGEAGVGKPHAGDVNGRDNSGEGLSADGPRLQTQYGFQPPEQPRTAAAAN